jgi:IS605 OrfB family transposase
MQNSIQLAPEDLVGIEVNRCYRSKIQCQKGDELYQALLNTHIIFNQKVAEVIRRIMAVLNNKQNPEFAKLTRWAIMNISPAGQCSSHFANPFTLEESRANPTHTAYNKNHEMRELFRLCKERGDRWYKREEVFGDLIEGKGASGLVSEVNQAAIEKICAYFRLMENWRKGDFTPPNQMKPDDFIKKYSSFIKKNRELLLENESFECLAELLEAKDAKLKGLLREMHATQLASAETLNVLGKAYQIYSDEALGKQAWLRQKKAFEAHYPEFLDRYKTILAAYNQILNKNNKQTTGETDRIPKSWFRDPNFLQTIEQEGPKGIFGAAFRSPLQDPDTIVMWGEQRAKNPDWPEWNDIKVISTHRDGCELYAKRLEVLNPELFAKDGWFGLLKAFRPYEGPDQDEFRKPPAFRVPDPKYHPEWLTFSDKGCFQYRNLKVIGPALIEITVNLIDPKTQSFKPYKMQVKLDSRLKTLQPAQNFEVPKGRWMKDAMGQRIFDWQQNEEGEYLYETESFYPWVDPNGEVQRISIHGGNLLHQKNAFYLHFRYTYKAPFKQAIREVEQINPAFAYKVGTRLLAFDLGQKADAVLAGMELAETDLGQPDLRIVKFRPFHFKKKADRKGGLVAFQWIKLPGGNSFKAINHAEKVKRIKLSKMKRHEAHWLKELPSKGKTPPKALLRGRVKGLFAARNQDTLKRLNTYIRNCREQHCKQLAGVIVKIAEENGFHGIVHENLENYRMSVKQRRFENQRLQVWAAQKTLDFLKTLCEAKGILCFPKSAAYTSQTCNRCGEWGLRFNVPTKQRWARLRSQARYAAMGETPKPIIEKGGDWFICSNERCCGKKEPENPNTRYIIQADANAAKNLLIRAFKKESWGARITDEKERERIQDSLQTWLLEVYAPKLAGKSSV